MSSLPCDNRGFTLVEAIIAIFITVVAVLGIFALITPGWKTAARSDYMGRASGILYETLMKQEALILNPCCIVVAGVTGPATVFASGQTTAIQGDVPFNVTTTITGIPTGSPSAWRVTVQVSWPPLNPAGITESLIVAWTGQERFRSGCTSPQWRVNTCS